jgi:hypothetical protein
MKSYKIFILENAQLVQCHGTQSFTFYTEEEAMEFIRLHCKPELEYVIALCYKV